MMASPGSAKVGFARRARVAHRSAGWRVSVGGIPAKPANNALHADLRESGRVDDLGLAIRSGWCDHQGGTARRRVNAGR
jgi:hypothetical protein